jgi:RND family efflux transporter MFP subunit
MTKNYPSAEATALGALGELGEPSPATDPVVRDVKLILTQSEAFQPVAPQGRKSPLRFLWLLCLPILGLIVWYIYSLAVPANSGGASITAKATKGELVVTVTERGELESAKSVLVRCEVEGERYKIIEILPEGTLLKKGQEVLRLDAEELTRRCAEQEVKFKAAEGKSKATKEKLEQAKYKAEGEIAEAELAHKLALLDRDKYLQGEYKVEVDDKKGAIALAEKDLQEATEKLEHYRKFVKNGFGTPEQLRLKEAEVDRAKFYLQRDKAKLEVLEKYTRLRQETELTAKAKEAERKFARVKSSAAAAISEAQSEYDAAEITARLEQRTLERSKEQIERCSIKAPQDGILVYANARYYDGSSRIAPGGLVWFQQPLFTIPDLTQMQVKMKVHEAMVKKVKVGHRAELRVDAYPGKVLHGRVKSVGTLADNPPWDERGVKEYATVITIDDLPLEAGLKPGMTAETRVFVSTLPDVLMVPVQAVTERDGIHYAYLITRGGPEKREVLVGENNDKFVEVKSGLQEGEDVALDARSRIVAETKGSTNGNGNGKREEPVKPLPAQVGPRGPS